MFNSFENIIPPILVLIVGIAGGILANHYYSKFKKAVPLAFLIVILALVIYFFTPKYAYSLSAIIILFFFLFMLSVLQRIMNFFLKIARSSWIIAKKILSYLFSLLKKLNMFKRISDVEFATEYWKDFGSVLSAHAEQLASLESVPDDVNHINEKIKGIERKIIILEAAKKQDSPISKPKEATLESIRGKLIDEEISVIKYLGNIEGTFAPYKTFNSLMKELFKDNYKIKRSTDNLQNLNIIYDVPDYDSFGDTRGSIGIALTEFGFKAACYYLDIAEKNADAGDKPPF